MLKWLLYKNAVHVSKEDRRPMVKDVKNYLLSNPKEPFYFSSTGNTLIIGFRFNESDEIEIYDCKIRRTTTIPTEQKSNKNINLDNINCDELVNSDKVRYRTFKVYKDSNEIVDTRDVIGKIIAVTVPLDDTNKVFAVDFAFCSEKDDFDKDVGKDIAFTRLVDKIFNKEDIYIIDRGEDKMKDIIKSLIIEEFSNKISWLRNVKKEDII